MSAIDPTVGRELRQCHVLIIEDNREVADNFCRWAREECERRDPPIEVRVEMCVEPHREEMETWFRRRYSGGSMWNNPQRHFDIVTLDVMFQARDGRNQTRGGWDLWRHLENQGIAELFDQLLVASNDDVVNEFGRLGDKVQIMANKDKDRFQEVFNVMLDKFLRGLPN